MTSILAPISNSLNSRHRIKLFGPTRLKHWPRLKQTYGRREIGTPRRKGKNLQADNCAGEDEERQEEEEHKISMHMEYCLNIMYMKMIEYGITTLFLS